MKFSIGPTLGFSFENNYLEPHDWCISHDSEISANRFSVGPALLNHIDHAWQAAPIVMWWWRHLWSNPFR